jgi:type I restriction enzyme S subunit
MSAEVILTEYGPISTQLKHAKLSELCVDKIGVQTGPFGSQLHNEDYVKVGTPIITVEHLGENRIGHLNTPLVSDEDKNRLSRYHLEEGDIVFSRVGSVDRRALVRKEEDGWLFSGRCLRVRVDKEKIDPVYLSYFFGLESFKNYIRSIAVGATMPSINTKILSDVPIYYPEDLNEQRRIAEIFYAIDEKIELNRQTNQTLEQIAQAIFKSWFVDFEPVKAKIVAKQNGQDPELAAICAISGKTEEQLNALGEEALRQLKATAALFPDAMVESELGEVPEGWKVTLNGDVMNVRDGTHDSPKQSETGFPLVTSKHITTGVLNIKDAYLISEQDYENVNKRSNVEQGDILLTMIGTVGIPYLVIQPEINFAIKNIGLFRTSEAVELKNYFYLLLKSKGMQQYLEARMAGTTQKYLSLKTLRTIEIILPTREVLSAFNGAVEPLLIKIFDGLSENESLSDIRNTLLPKLLSGELSLDNPQSREEAVA